MKISAKEAKQYFSHPSQIILGTMPDEMPDEGFEYYAADNVCLVFHRSLWPGVWMVHVGVKPEAWGHTAEVGLGLLKEFWEAEKPVRITGWTDSRNRAALALSRRCGFEIDGVMKMNGHEVIMQGWANGN